MPLDRQSVRVWTIKICPVCDEHVRSFACRKCGKWAVDVKVAPILDSVEGDGPWTIHICEDHRVQDCSLCGVFDVVTVVRESSYATDAARWFARNIIGDEMRGGEPLPVSMRELIAQAMVDDAFMGWPDVEAAYATLDEWKWAS